LATPQAHGKPGRTAHTPPTASLKAKLATKTGMTASDGGEASTHAGGRAHAKLVGGTKVATLKAKGYGSAKTGGPQNGSSASSKNGGGKRHHRHHHHHKGKSKTGAG